MSRYSDIDDDTRKIIHNIVHNDFKHLLNAKIKYIFDSKKRKSGGRYVLGKLTKTSELIRFLTVNDTSDAQGFDYMLFIDERIFEAIEQSDKIRLIRHLLQYADIDYDSEKPYKLRKEEVLTWYDEIEYNKEDPKWQERLEIIAESIYDPESQKEEEPITNNQ